MYGWICRHNGPESRPWTVLSLVSSVCMRADYTGTRFRIMPHRKRQRLSFTWVMQTRRSIIRQAA